MLYEDLDEEIEDADIGKDEDEAATGTSGVLLDLSITQTFAQFFGQVDHSKDTIQEEKNSTPQTTVGLDANKRELPYEMMEVLPTEKKLRVEAFREKQANNGRNNNPTKLSSRMATRRPEIQLAPNLNLDSGVMAQVPMGLLIPGLYDLSLKIMSSQIAVAGNEVQALEVQDSQLQTVFPSTSAVFARAVPSVAAPSVSALPTAQNLNTSGDADPEGDDDDIPGGVVEKFVQDRDHSLFGILHVKIFSFHDPKRPQDIHEQVFFSWRSSTGQTLTFRGGEPHQCYQITRHHIDFQNTRNRR